jgi:phage terminase Nu1 subunit (DNA packaging protein)
MGQRVNRSDLASVFGVSLPTINAWVKRGCPVVQRGRKGKPWEFDTADVANWREQQAAEAAVGDTSKLDIDEAKRRKEAADAALKELELARLRNEVVSVSLIADVIGDQFSTCRARLLALPAKAAPLVIGHEDLSQVRDILEQQVRDALAELSGYDGDAAGDDAAEDPEADADEPSPSDAEAAAAADAQ